MVPRRKQEPRGLRMLSPIAAGGRGGGSPIATGGRGGGSPIATGVRGGGSPIATGGQGAQNHDKRPLERHTWKGVLHRHADHNKRFKILPRVKSRKKGKGSCVFYSVATALKAANRICGVEVDELSWEELYDIVGPDNPLRTVAALRALKYRGTRRRTDYEKRNLKCTRYKISQFYHFCNVDIVGDNAPCGLDRENTKAAIDNFLSRTVLLAHFPISKNYFDLVDGGEHVYFYDKDDPVVEENGGAGGIPTHLAVVTGFGFEEDIPYFEFQDSNGKKFGKKGFDKILPSSIMSLYAFDVIID